MEAETVVMAAERSQRDIRRTGIDRDFWFPVARTRDVKPGRPHAVSFAGEPVVIARTSGGELFALEDRCAHRQVPLRHGVVTERSIRCGYHGWEYGADGQCISVPYLDSCSMKPNCVRSYPVREAYGLVFIFPGAPSRASTVPFPEVPSASDPAYKTRYLDRRVGCHYTFMHENLMDMNHQFLHRRLMGGIRTLYLGSREGPNWVEADYTFKRASGKQPLGEKVMLGKRPTAAVGERDLMTIRTEYPYQTLRFWTAGSEHPALDLWNVYIPVDREQRENHTFGLMMIRRPGMRFLLDLMWPAIVWFTNGIFAEDRWICELEQAAFDEVGADRNHEIFPAIRSLRRVLVDNGIPLESSDPQVQAVPLSRLAVG
ncbi:MAG: Rieske 2Fe-2S domain-containing protein [Gammaproteobacteria bacterium]|jgi:phenylpropionate dioxygenase-like ring-hydroxylating dioxygenase large terminal subunit